MKLLDQVCTIYQAKTLSELGIKQGCSAFFYDTWMADKNRLQYNQAFQNTGTYLDAKSCYSAFNVAELGVMLPSGFDSMYLSVEKGWRGYDDDSQDYPYAGCLFPTEAFCRAEMLINFICNMKSRVEQVNQRLLNE